MGRPGLPPNTWGTIDVDRVSTGWKARGIYRDFTGKKHDWSCIKDSKVEAERALRAKADKYQQPQGDLTKTSTMEELFHAWREEKAKDVSTITVDDYKQVWRRALQERFGELRIQEVTTHAIHTHLNSLTPANSRRGRVVLKGMFEHAEQHDLIIRNPVRAAKAVKRRAKPVQALDEEQVADVFRTFRDYDEKPRRGPKSPFRLVDYFLVMLGTGLRPGECLALTWSDIDLHYGPENRVAITVTGTLQHRDGKGRGPLVKSDMPKSDSSARTLVATHYAEAVIRRMHSERTITPTNALFVTSKGTWMSLANVGRLIRKLRSDLDLEWMSSHTFRKTAATYVTNKLGEEQAYRLLGHAGPEVTRQFYIDSNQIVPDATYALELLAPLFAD